MGSSIYFTSPLKTSYIGSLPTRLFPICRNVLSNPIRVNFSACSVISHIEEHKPDIFFIDCSNFASTSEFLSQMSNMPINGTAFIGTTLIDQRQPNPLSRYYELKGNLSNYFVKSIDGNVPILSDVIEVSSLESLASVNFPLAENNLLFSLKNAIELAKSRRDVLTDRLTGTLGGKAFEMMLNEEILRTARSQENATIVFGDLRRFKELNDTFGHTLADQVLIRFSEIFKNSTRKSDIISRPHGDEFLFLFPATSEEGASKILKNILDKVLSTPSPFSDIHPDITPAINFGAITFNMSNRAQAKTLYKLAKDYFESMGKEFESKMLGKFLIDSADKLSYLSRAKGENTFLVANMTEIEKIQNEFKNQTKFGRER